MDWAQQNMAIARMTPATGKIRTIDVPSDIKECKLYLKQLRGTKILAFEETTSLKTTLVYAKRDAGALTAVVQKDWEEQLKNTDIGCKWLREKTA